MEKDGELTISDKINDFFVRNRKILLIILALVLLVVLIVIGVVVFFDTQRTTAINEIEAAIADFQKFKTEKIKNADNSLSDEEKKLLTDKETKLIETLSKYSEQKNYAGFMAIQQIGDIYFKNGDFEKALHFYEKMPLSANRYPSGILLFNAAMCADELGQNEKAMRLFIEASGCTEFPFKARALFNAARVQESLDGVKAIETYKQLIASYPDTQWANLAKTRVIELELK